MSERIGMTWHQLTPAYDPGRFYKDIRLYVFLGGSVTLTLHGREETFGEGELFLVNSFQEEALRLGEGVAGVVLIIPERFLSEYVDPLQISFFCDSRKADYGPYEYLRACLRKSLFLSADQSSLGQIRKAESDCRVMGCLLEHFTRAVSDGKQLSKEERKEYILRYIHHNYRRQFSLQDLSDRLGLSLPYLSKYIKGQIGCGFNTYVNQVRLRYAMEEMSKGEKSFLKAAVNHGFANMASFQRVFQDVYGMMPSEYKIHLEKQVPEWEINGEEKYQELVEKWERLLPIGQEWEKRDCEREEKRIEIRLDTNQKELYEDNWLEVLNLGEAEDLLRGDVQMHISQLKKELHFKYGRVRGLFNSRLLVDINAKDGFNFSRVERVLDFLVSVQILPFCDMGFKESNIYANAGEKPLKTWEQREKFTGIDQYEKLIRQFMRHCIRRYGENQVEQWKFELNWYVSAAWKGIDPQCRSVFMVLYRVIKQYSPGSLVGGFGFNVYDSNRQVKDYLRHSKKDEIRPDFLTFLLYPYEIRSEGNPLIRNPNYIEQELKALGELAKKHGYTREQLYVTEWNVSISNMNFLHDSCYKGAWLLRNTALSLGLVRTMAYWGNTDRSADFFDAVSLLNGRNGLISRSGICKPAYYAYDFLNRQEKYLVSKGPDYILTTDGEGNYTIVCNYWHPLKEQYYQEYKENISHTQMAGFFGSSRRTLEFTLTHVPDGRYKVEKLFVNQYAGSVFDEWMRMGSPDSYGKREEEYLSAVCVPHLHILYVESRKAQLTIETSMAENEIQLLHIFLETGENERI